MTKFLTLLFEGADLRVMYKDKELWFLGRDLCAALEIGNIERALGSINRAEKLIVETGTHATPRKEMVVAYPGAFCLARDMRTPVGKRFQRWLRREVSPVEVWLHDYASSPDDMLNKMAADHEEVSRRARMHADCAVVLRNLEAWTRESQAKLVQLNKILKRA